MIVTNIGGAKRSMDEVPVSSGVVELPTQRFVKQLKKFPQKRLIFVTIKDNSQKTKWIKIGKVNDWIRRYSKTYFIVKGTNGGIHFHLIAGIESNKTVKPQKGIHFHIRNIGIVKSLLTGEEIVELSTSARQSAYYKSEKFEELTSDVDIECQCIISQITAMIKSHWHKVSLRSKTKLRKLKVSDNVDRAINYLLKNLEEPREDDDLTKYCDYIERY